MAEPMIQITHARPIRWWLTEALRFVAITTALTLFLGFAYALAGAGPA